MSEDEGIGPLQESSDDSRQLLVVNHPRRPAYRMLAGLIGGLFVLFGVIALFVAGDVPAAGRFGHGLVGLVVNRSTGIVWIVFGLVVLLGAVLADNTGAYTLTASSLLILVVGLFFLGVSRTPANLVAYSVMDVCVTWVAGMVVGWCAMQTFVLDEDHKPVKRKAKSRPPEHTHLREDTSLRP